MEKFLKIAEHLADMKQEQINKMYYEKYKDVYDIAIKFFAKEKVLLYGGYAINSILPNKYKFYSKYELPDIDLFTSNAKEIAHKLVHFYKTKGYVLASASEALHPSTWKVMVAGLQVADISSMTKEGFAVVAKGSLMNDVGLRVCNPEFLRMTLYELLSQPEDANRWKKVIERLLIFNKVFPPSSCKVNRAAQPAEIPEHIHEYVNQVNQYISEQTSYVLMGMQNALVGQYTKKHIIMGNSALDVLVDMNPRLAAANVLKNVPHEDIQLGVFDKGDQFIPSNTYLMYHNKPLIGFYRTEMCLSYVKLDGRRIATLPTLIRMYYSIYFSSLNRGIIDRHIQNLTCTIQMLIALSMQSIGSHKKLLQQFVLECYGHQDGIVTLRREKYIRLKNNRQHSDDKNKK